MQVDLLLDRVEAEAEPEGGDRAAQDPRLAGEQRRPRAPRGREGGEPEDDDDDEGQEPELHPAPLDHLDRRRARLAQSRDPGLMPDSLTDLHWELIHGPSRRLEQFEPSAHLTPGLSRYGRVQTRAA